MFLVATRLRSLTGGYVFSLSVCPQERGGGYPPGQACSQGARVEYAWTGPRGTTPGQNQAFYLLLSCLYCVTGCPTGYGMIKNQVDFPVWCYLWWSTKEYWLRWSNCCDYQRRFDWICNEGMSIHSGLSNTDYQ